MVGSCVFVLWSGVGDCLRAVVGVDMSGCRLLLLLSGGPESVEVALCVFGVVLCSGGSCGCGGCGLIA